MLTRVLLFRKHPAARVEMSAVRECGECEPRIIFARPGCWSLDWIRGAEKPGDGAIKAPSRNYKDPWKEPYRPSLPPGNQASGRSLKETAQTHSKSILARARNPARSWPVSSIIEVPMPMDSTTPVDLTDNTSMKTNIRNLFEFLSESRIPNLKSISESGCIQEVYQN